MVTLIRQLLDVLDPAEKRSVILLAGLMTLVAFFEVAGLASVMPLLALVGDPGIITRNEWAAKAYTMLGAESQNQFVVYCGIFSLAMLVISNAVRFFSAWAVLRFAHMTNYSLSSRLFRFYIMQPYSFFFSYNSSDIIKNVLHEVASISSLILQKMLMVFSRGVIIVSLLIFMLFVNPQVSLAIFLCFGGCYALAYLLTKRIITRIARKRLYAMECRYRVAGEAFRSVKEVKASNSEGFFYEKFREFAHMYARQCTSNEVIAMSPRFCLEVIAYGSMVVLVMVFFHSGWNTGYILPLLGMYAFGGMKMMPALQQVFEAVTNIRFYAPALRALHSDLSNHAQIELEGEEGEVLAFTDAIRFENVCFSYAEDGANVIDNLNLTIRKNEMVGIVGATGSGKTTTIDMLLGLIAPGAGTLSVDGVPVNAETVRAWRKHIGYVPQSINLLDDTVRMNIALGFHEENVDDERVVSSARVANIHDHIANRMPEGYGTVIGEQGVRLSGGQRQRVGIARALYRGADVLVLDEATSALDAEMENRVMESISSFAGCKTIIVIAHRLSTLQRCDVIYEFENGKATRVGNYADLCARNGLYVGSTSGISGADVAGVENTREGAF